MSAAPHTTRTDELEACPQLQTLMFTIPENQLARAVSNPETKHGKQSSYTNTLLLKDRASLVTTQTPRDDGWKDDALTNSVDTDVDVHLVSGCWNIEGKVKTTAKERNDKGCKLANLLKVASKNLSGLMDGRRCKNQHWSFFRTSDHLRQSSHTFDNAFKFTGNDKINLYLDQSLKPKKDFVEVDLDIKSKTSAAAKCESCHGICSVQGEQWQGQLNVDDSFQESYPRKNLEEKSEVSLRVILISEINEEELGFEHCIRRLQGTKSMPDVPSKAGHRSDTKYRILKVNSKGRDDSSVFYPLRKADARTELCYMREHHPIRVPGCISLASKASTVCSPRALSPSRTSSRSLVKKGSCSTKSDQGKVSVEGDEVEQTEADLSGAEEEADDPEEPPVDDKNSTEESKIEKLFKGKEMCGYKFVKKLASGASSVIFKVTKKGVPYAAKVFKRIYSSPLKSHNLMHHEFKLLKKLQHPHVIKVFARFISMSYAVIVMEYMNGGNLWTHYEKEWPVPEDVTKKILWDILTAIRFVHKHRVVHMDIKSNNFLINSKGCVKLADFGGAKKFGGFYKRGTRVSFFTPEWAPPEKHLERENGTPIFVLHKRYDMWSFGVLVHQLTTGKLPYYLEEGKRFLSRETFNDPVHLPDGHAEDDDHHLLSLIRDCMRINPIERLRSKQALLHPFFDSLTHGD